MRSKYPKTEGNIPSDIAGKHKPVMVDRGLTPAATSDSGTVGYRIGLRGDGPRSNIALSTLQKNMEDKMVQWVDFAEIRSKVSLEAVLFQYYAINNLKRHGSKVIGPCPVHGGDSPRAFHADLGKNIWHCFSQCKRGGNQLDFVALKEGISIRAAAVRLQEVFLDSPKSPPTPPQPAPAAKPERKKGGEGSSTGPPISEHNPILKVELNLKAEHPHILRDRGLSLETINHFGIGYCSKGIMRGCIAIPIHDDLGNLVAYAGRRLKPSDIDQYGKYKFPRGFRKELVLHNLNRAKEEAQDKGLILVEGFFSVFHLHQAGFTNVVAAMGCELSDHQARLLAQAKEVVVLFDGNQAGWSGAEAVRQKLAGQTIVRIARLPENTEPDDLSRQELRWLINGLQVLNLEDASFRFRSPEVAE